MSVLVEAHDRVEARVAEIMGTLNAATAALVRTIGEVLEHDTWTTAAGIKSPEHWVTWQCGVSHARAEALVRVARRRSELPKSAALFDAGQITEDVMAAIARRGCAERDVEIAEQAHRLLYSQVDRMLRTMPQPERPRAEPEDRVTFGSDGERWKLHANLPLDQGALVEKAITAARSEVFFERQPDAEVENRSKVSWADGLVRAAELALQRLDGGDTGRRPADRHQVWIHLDAAESRANTHLGDVLPDSLRRYLLCDVDIRAIIESDGALAAISSKLRTVDGKMRAFIEQRDGGCRVPGCEQRRWLHVHHIRHWEEGGQTVSWNLCALCPMHHRLHHRGLLEIRGNPDIPNGLRFFDTKGREICAIEREPRAVSSTVAARPYVHPPGERVNWHWFNWMALDDAARN